jgi:hypothetical protein
MNDEFNSKKHTSIYHLLALHNVSLIESITRHSRGTLLQSVHNDEHFSLHKDTISHRALSLLLTAPTGDFDEHVVSTVGKYLAYMCLVD